ncbi:MAG TPA: Ig-like domain-containing protein [Gemmatimonadaceae bacterium]|nr:Ig-like domain-containing protein [Gemmatimonadaceae bacterium]
MRYRIPVVALAAVAFFGYGCVQGKVLDDPANARTTQDTSTTISLLTISPTSFSGTVGQSKQLTATATNQNGQPITGATFTWASSNTQVASVDTSGNVTLVGVGSANISASSGGLTTSIPATATAASIHVATVSVNPSTVTLNPGNTAQLTAVAMDSLGNVLANQTVTWSSSNTSVATVSATGLLSAVTVGSAVISATAGGKSGFANVAVVAASPASVASVTVSPATASITAGKTVQLTATLKDSVGNVLGGRTVTWSSSNPSVATVSSNGVVTGVAAGTATISAASGGQQGSAQITVNAVVVSSVQVSPGWANLSARQTLQLTATPLDANGNPMGGVTIAWLSNAPSLASVSSSGLVTVLSTTGTGSVQIYATAGGQTGHSTITFIAAPVATVTLSSTTVTLNAGQTSQLTATAKDQYGDVITTDAATWSSSNTSVATVSSSGLVTAVGSGSATITVTIGGVQATASVTVAQAAVASVTVSPTSLSLTAGQSSGLTATAKDGSGNVLTGYPATWTSSNTSAATVSTSGVVTGVAAGTATITVTIGGKSATASVTVTAPTQTVSTVSVSPATTSIQVGNQVQLTATDKTSSGGVVTGQSVSWSSSNTAAATVSSGGIITAVAVGSATITATSDGVKGTASVTVTAASSGSYHEPAGMTMQINTGPMTTAPANNGSVSQWTEGTATFTNFSPVSPIAVGSLFADAAANITSIPGESGLRVNYPTDLAGGYSPVRWGTSIPGVGTGYLYIRFKIRLSPNWTLSQALGIKVMEPRTSSGVENHVISLTAADGTKTGSDMWVQWLLQGGSNVDLPGAPQGFTAPRADYLSSLANLGGSALGSWHTVEVYCVPESPAGARNGQLTWWVDGTMVWTSVGVTPGTGGLPSAGIAYWSAGETQGWNYLLFDPTYGGDSDTDHPPYLIYWDLDQLYVSTK